ncbi:MAG TPA: thioredoxin-like domain-containing protein [Ohtaekwangia sp.]|uniref:TlpA family protein disulfide reductase n=1 Tax=Ohtaekwangia sp. TaxID=2066019 RepID=UPI002F929C4B
MKKIFLIVYIALLVIPPGYSQAIKRTRFVIGETLPEITLNNLINYPKHSEQLSAFHGKTVVLYFWNEGCSSSIRDWPKLLKLQHDFSKDIQIILVNESQDEMTVKRIVADQSKIVHVAMTLPIVCRDSDLNNLFPRNSVPHLIWIDPAGRLMAVTSSDQLNERNVRALAGDGEVTMIQKDGVRYKVDFSKPLYIGANGGTGDHLLWQSVISEYYPGIYGTMLIDSCSATMSNTTLVTMFRFLFKGKTNWFGALNLFPESRVELQVKDTTKYIAQVKGETQAENYFTYHLYSRKPQPQETMRAAMMADLKRYFGVDCYWSRATRMCLVLSAGDTTLLGNGSGEPTSIMLSTRMELNNLTITEVLENLLATTDYHHSPYPIVDETDIKRKIGKVKFEANIMNHADLNKALNKYGLAFTLQPREVEILVLYETDHFTPKEGAVHAN